MVVGETRVGRKIDAGCRGMSPSASERKTGVSSPVVVGTPRDEEAAEVKVESRLRMGEGGGGSVTRPTSVEVLRVLEDEAARLPSPPATADLDLRSP